MWREFSAFQGGRGREREVEQAMRDPIRNLFDPDKGGLGLRIAVRLHLRAAILADTSANPRPLPW
jgi:hypothetical protein